MSQLSAEEKKVTLCVSPASSGSEPVTQEHQKELRTLSQEVLPFSKGLARTDFTAGSQIGTGAYGTVYKV
jgi:hypothetical protein